MEVPSRNEPVRIALVDDDRASAMLLAAQLEEAPGLVLASATPTLEEGLAAAAGGGVDVLLLDLKRPDGVGPGEAVALARAAAPDCLVLLYSALSELELARVAAAAGADGAVSKGSGVPGLGAAIASARGPARAPAGANDPG